MPWSIDARVPVSLRELGEVTAADALLVEGSVVPGDHAALETFDVVVEGHAPGCACCLPQSAAGAALNRLFQRRARGEVAFFRRVIAVTSTEEGAASVRAALASDPLASARFRLA